MTDFYVATGNSGHLRHAVVAGVALCGYKPSGVTAMGRGRARWNYVHSAMVGSAAAVSCEKCKAKLAAPTAESEERNHK